MKENRGFWFVWIVYVLLMLADFMTTLANPNHYGLETNIIYLWSGSFWPIILLNVIFLYGFYWIYHATGENPVWRFMMLNVMVIVCAGRVWAIKNAVYWLLNPGLAASVAVNAGVAVKLEAQKTLSLLIYSPIVLAWFTFVFWKWDHYVYRKDVREEDIEE